MLRKRAHVILPADLLAEVDRLVGARGRSAFLADLVRREIQRRNLLAALREARGSWKTEEHPELQEGSKHSSTGCVPRMKLVCNPSRMPDAHPAARHHLSDRCLK